MVLLVQCAAFTKPVNSNQNLDVIHFMIKFKVVMMFLIELTNEQDVHLRAHWQQIGIFAERMGWILCCYPHAMRISDGAK